MRWAGGRNGRGAATRLARARGAGVCGSAPWCAVGVRAGDQAAGHPDRRLLASRSSAMASQRTRSNARIVGSMAGTGECQSPRLIACIASTVARTRWPVAMERSPRMERHGTQAVLNQRVRALDRFDGLELRRFDGSGTDLILVPNSSGRRHEPNKCRASGASPWCAGEPLGESGEVERHRGEDVPEVGFREPDVARASQPATADAL